MKLQTMTTLIGHQAHQQYKLKINPIAKALCLSLLDGDNPNLLTRER